MNESQNLLEAAAAVLHVESYGIPARILDRGRKLAMKDAEIRQFWNAFKDIGLSIDQLVKKLDNYEPESKD